MITPEQREARRRSIGSSDIAAIVGVDPYRSPADVYWAKKGVDTPENDAMRFGSACERIVLDWAENEIGDPLVRDLSLVSRSSPIFAANLDGRGQTTGAIVEAKTHGLFGPSSSDWGQAGTDEVPDKVLVQVQWQMFVSEADLAYVAALIGGRGAQLYRVVRNEALIDSLSERGMEFWESHVLPGVPPDDAPSLATALQIPRVPGKRTAVSEDIVLAWEDAKRRAREATAEADAHKALLLQQMGDATIGEFGGGEVVVTVGERKGYTVEPGTRTDVRVKKRKEDA